MCIELVEVDNTVDLAKGNGALSKTSSAAYSLCIEGLTRFNMQNNHTSLGHSRQGLDHKICVPRDVVNRCDYITFENLLVRIRIIPRTDEPTLCYFANIEHFRQLVRPM